MFVLSTLFMNFLLYFAVKYVQQLEDISKSSKYWLGYILKGQKVLNDRMNLEITKRRHLENSALRRDWH